MQISDQPGLLLMDACIPETPSKPIDDHEKTLVYPSPLVGKRKLVFSPRNESSDSDDSDDSQKTQLWYDPNA